MQTFIRKVMIAQSYFNKSGDEFIYNKKGQYHNEDGPAIIYKDGSIEYYVNDVELSEKEFKIYQRSKKL